MKKVLVIDDDEPIRLNLSDLLTQEDFEVIDAPNGIQGLQLAFEKPPDLIICDVNMPDIDGFQVLRKIRENLATAQIPFIFLSAGEGTGLAPPRFGGGNGRANSWSQEKIHLPAVLSINYFPCSPCSPCSPCFPCFPNFSNDNKLALGGMGGLHDGVCVSPEKLILPNKWWQH